MLREVETSSSLAKPTSLAAAIPSKITRAISPYSFRRFVGVEMIRSGKCNVLHVQQMLNHSNLKHVHLYTKMMSIDLKNAHAKMSRENREPTGDLGFKGFDGGKAVFFRKNKGK